LVHCTSLLHRVRPIHRFRSTGGDERTARIRREDRAVELRLEITERALIERSEAAVAALWQARAAGIQVQLDDFGTGYSSLSYLHRFPIDLLKIDRSFISNGEVRIENTEIVRAIVTLAQNRHIGVTAEGVETVEQVAQLRDLGCTYGQGHYFSPPLDAQMAGRLLARHLPTHRNVAAS
jgi:EAL domain-containing protein (putative c-di-GMP-specific phosphodiesterase class I)